MSRVKDRGQYTEEHVIKLFDRYLTKTGIHLPNIHQVSIVQNDDEEEQVEEQLVLYDRRLQAPDMRILKTYVNESHPFLTKLHLNHNRVRPEGAKILSTLLENDATGLQQLFLNRNELGNEGAEAIANAMLTNTRLYELKLAENYVKDQGATAVAEMIKVNSTLRGLEFDGNRYTATGTSLLADALNRNEGLRIFQVGESRNIKDRLTFARMMIQTEDESRPRTSTVLCFSKDKNNDVIDMILAEWRLCKKEGQTLVDIPREKLERFKKFNKFSEQEFNDLKEEIRLFLHDVREKGVKNLRRAKILVMGRAGAGKTSLVRSIVAGRSLLTGDGPDRATQSVEISKYAAGLKEIDVRGELAEQKNVKATFWDFGGQEEYYMTHSFFVSPRSVILICINAAEFYKTKESEDTYKSQIQYFVDSMQTHAPGAKFIVVGTHSEQLSRRQVEELEVIIRRQFEAFELKLMDKIADEINELNGHVETYEAPGLNGLLSGEDNFEDPFDSNDTSVYRRGAITKLGGNMKNRAKIIDSHQLSGPGTQLAELDIDSVSRSGLQEQKSSLYNSKKSSNSRRSVNRAQLANSKRNLFEVPGMTVLEGIEVRVVNNPEIKKSKSSNKKNSSKLARLAQKKFNFDSKRRNELSAKEKLKEEAMNDLQKRRENRPKLIDIRFVSSGAEYLGIKEFKDELDKVLTNEKDNDVSVLLPKPYATLYESISGEDFNLKNESLNVDLELVKQPSVKLGGPFKRMSTKAHSTKRLRNKNRKKTKGNNSMLSIQKSRSTPIVPMSELYDEFLSKPKEGHTKSIIPSQLRSKRNLPKVKLFSTAEELHRALRTLHEIGYLLWFDDNELLRDIVFVDPKWVVSMIRTVIRHNMFGEGEGSLETVEAPESMSQTEFDLIKEKLKNTAILDSRLLFQFDVWKDATTLERFNMIKLMQSFDLLCEAPREVETDKTPKYFVPLYLKSVFLSGNGEENSKRMLALENEIVGNVATVPKFARSLFTPNMGLTNSQKQSRGKQKSAFFETDSTPVRPKNIQWRYEFENLFPEGLFLRLLVRCNPYFSFHEHYAPTESFVVGRSVLGVTIFIQAEREKFDLAGALVLTAIQEQVVQSESFSYNMSDIWQVFSILTFELDDLLHTFPGLQTKVLVSVVHEGCGKVSVKRRELEMEELTYNANVSKGHKNLTVNLKDYDVPLYFLIPPLYVLPRDINLLPAGSDTVPMSPQLVRLSKFARIEYGLLSIGAQMGDDLSGKKERISILHSSLLDCLDKILKQLCSVMMPDEKTLIRGFEDALVFLKKNNLKNYAEFEPDILAMKKVEQASIMGTGTTVTAQDLKTAASLCNRLFEILEVKLVTKKTAPSKPRRLLF